jgi:hypothetical protein
VKSFLFSNTTKHKMEKQWLLSVLESCVTVKELRHWIVEYTGLTLYFQLTLPLSALEFTCVNEKDQLECVSVSKRFDLRFAITDEKTFVENIKPEWTVPHWCNVCTKCTLFEHDMRCSYYPMYYPTQGTRGHYCFLYSDQRRLVLCRQKGDQLNRWPLVPDLVKYKVVNFSLLLMSTQTKLLMLRQKKGEKGITTCLFSDKKIVDWDVCDSLVAVIFQKRRDKKDRCKRVQVELFELCDLGDQLDHLKTLGAMELPRITLKNGE